MYAEEKIHTHIPDRKVVLHLHPIHHRLKIKIKYIKFKINNFYRNHVASEVPHFGTETRV